jgi:heme oxygenase
MEYTIEIYKADKRKKEGRKLVDRIEIDAAEKADVVAIAEDTVAKGAKLSYEVHESYREVRNAMSGKIVKEHYLTPWSCSVASESYWCS